MSKHPLLFVTLLASFQKLRRVPFLSLSFEVSILFFYLSPSLFFAISNCRCSLFLFTMNHLRQLFDSEESIQEFKTLHNIPDDVVVRLPANSDNIIEGSDERIPLPLIGIVEGGVQFPLYPLLKQVLHFYGVPLSQLAPSFLRIVMGVIALNNILGVNLGLLEIRYCYNCVPTTKEIAKFYFKNKLAKHQLVQMLTDSGKGVNDIIVIVESNLELPLGVDRVRLISNVLGQPG